MTYETIDWEIEAKRIAWAFGVSKPCSWDEELLDWADDSAPKGTEPKTSVNMRLKLANSKNYKINIRNEQFLHCIYNAEGRTFQVYDNEAPKGSPFYNMVIVSIAWDGSFDVAPITSENRLTLARALFFLSLLTCEIEDALRVHISAHQRLEWTLEYESQNGM